MLLEIVRPYIDPRTEKMLADMHPPRKALFLDRDGVINVDRGYVHRSEDTEWVSGIFDFCIRAQQASYLLIVVTNQAGISRGLYSEEEFLSYTQWMHEQFAARGVTLAATYYCPHHPDFTANCECRKPKPGMLNAAVIDYDLSVINCIFIGDKMSDIEAGVAAGLKKERLFNLSDESSPTFNAVDL